MFDLKNLKIVKTLKSIKPKLKWLMFSQMQDYKVNSKYIDSSNVKQPVGGHCSCIIDS